VQYIPARLFDPTAPEGALAPVKFGTDNNWQGGFSLNQTLFRGETIIGLSTSTIYRTVQDENLRFVSQQVITDTRIAYYQVLAAQEQLRLQQIQIKRINQNLNETIKRKEAGLVDDYDVLQLQVQLSNQKPLLIEAEYGVDEAYRNLKYIMGLPYQLDFDVLGNLNTYDISETKEVSEENEEIQKVDQLNLFSYSAESIISKTSIGKRGDLRVLDATLNLKDKEITAVRSRFLPTLSATYNLQWSAAEPGTPNFFEDGIRAQTLGLNLSLPLFQGFERNANVQRILIERKDLEEQVRATELLAQNQVVSASEDLNMAFEIATGRKIALQQAKEGYSRAQLRYNNGLGSQLEVLEAEVQVRQAEVNYAVMVFNYLTAKAQYDLATGAVPIVDISIN
jgi:outer membrane protein TolC